MLVIRPCTVRSTWLRCRSLSYVIPACVAALLPAFGRSTFGDEQASATDATGNPETVGPTVLTPPPPATDRSRYIGARACLDCHRSEYVSWLGTQHFKNTKKNRFEGSESSIDTKYKAEVGNLDLCYNCHSPPAEERYGRKLVETSTSCESCHGAAGGEGGWLNRHAVYGPNVTRLEDETPQHYADRTQYCDSAGMIRPGRQFEVARNCFSCHLIGEPILVGETVRHPVSFETFSLIPYLVGEVRHNFHRDQRHNAETPSLDTMRRGLSLQQRRRVYLVVEQLAKMQVALSYLARLPDDKVMQEDFARKLAGLVEDAAGELEDFQDELLDPEDENVAALSEEQVAAIQGAIDEFESFDNLDEPKRADALRSAQKIASLAAQFLSEHDGTRLGALDVFFEDLPDPVGKPLEP